tara:strand:- start:1066 stop:1209 length:144 start_codon:yes stop_codon:yes gene_type:complete
MGIGPRFDEFDEFFIFFIYPCLTLKELDTPVQGHAGGSVVERSRTLI